MHYEVTAANVELATTKRQRDILKAYIKLGTSGAVADKLGVDDGSVRRVLRKFGGDVMRLSELSAKPEPPNSLPRRIMVCPDAHHPFVDKRAWDCFLGAVEVVKPDVLVVIGDFTDSYRVSSHTKNPRVKLGLVDEIDSGNTALDELTRLGTKRVVYCEGNHENRLQRYIAEKAPELFGIVPDMRGLLQIDRRPGWEWHPYKTFVRIGKMAFTHDVGRAGVNAVRQSLIDFGDNLTFGHTHRLGVHYGATVDEMRHVCLNVGWLGDYNAIDYRHQFMARREWSHGFGDISMTPDGVAYARAVPIIAGKCVVNETEVKA